MFDILTYKKGAVLRMLEQYLGAERFRDGIRRYLDEHRFGNTETHDPWDSSIEKATDEPVRRIMDGWIWQGGYPDGLGHGWGTPGRAHAAPVPDLGQGGRHRLGRRCSWTRVGPTRC